MIQETAERVRRMERYFDMLQAAAETNPDAFRRDPSVKAILQALIRYYESEQWRKDYELDEKGLLPQDLKRGVLSQDAVYGFLDRIGMASVFCGQDVKERTSALFRSGRFL